MDEVDVHGHVFRGLKGFLDVRRLRVEATNNAYEESIQKGE